MNQFEKNLNELIELIASQEEVKRYLQIEEKMKENNFIKEKINQFKKLQQNIAIYESKQNSIPKAIQDEYDTLYNELMDIPIYNEYIDLQQEVNEIIQQIAQTIEEELNKK